MTRIASPSPRFATGSVPAQRGFHVGPDKPSLSRLVTRGQSSGVASNVIKVETGMTCNCTDTHQGAKNSIKLSGPFATESKLLEVKSTTSDLANTVVDKVDNAATNDTNVDVLVLMIA